MSIAGKTVLVTGGASGIGAGVVELFASKGAVVTVADVAEEAGRALASRLGGRHRFVRLDVSSQDAWASAMPQIAPDGTLDIAIFNAGVMTRPTGEAGLNDPLPWITQKSMNRLIGVNLFGSLWGILACLEAVEKANGTMMVVSSAGGLSPVSFDPPYAMTKSGLIGLATSFAPTLQEHGVRIVTVCPHSVDTAMQPPDLIAKRVAQGYSSPPSHMAESVLYIYEHAKTGDVWQSLADGLPVLVPPRGGPVVKTFGKQA